MIFGFVTKRWCSYGPRQILPTIQNPSVVSRSSCAGGRATSAPYPWYDSGLVGVTVAEPYHDATGALRGVIEIDFNVNSLSELATEMQAR